MAPRRKEKKGTLHYALEVCDRGQLKTIISTREGLDGKASMDVMNIIQRSRESSKVNLSPLQGAVSLGHYNICKQLVEEGAVLKSLSHIPHPLSLALYKRHYEIAHLLIQAGADVNLAAGESMPICIALNNTDCKVPIIKKIIEAGFPVDSIVYEPTQCTALHYAVKFNNIAVVKYLLSISANLNIKDRRGLTPLHYAVQKDLPAMVKLLSKHGAALDCECQEHFTPMFYAIAMGNYEMVKLLISLGSNIHLINGRKKCPLMPLHFAASICKFKMVQLLIEKGADVNKVIPKTGETPLLCAARGNTENNQQSKIALDCIVELLVKYKADVNVRHNYGLTPLQVAIKAKNISVAKILVTSGSELNNFVEESDEKGYTTFHIAAKCLDRELIKLFIDYGADCHIVDEDGLYPLQLALLSAMVDLLRCGSDYDQSHVSEDHLAIFKMFWKQGFPFDLTMKMALLDDTTPPIPIKISDSVKKQRMLNEGLKGLHLAVVEKAILQGADVKCCSFDIPFPVHFIASKGNYEILELFLIEGVNTNYLDKNGKSALYLAAKEGYTDCCRLLLEYGACYNHSSVKCPIKPIEVAKSNGHTEIVTLLTTVGKYFKDIKKGHLRKLRPDMKIFHAIMNCCENHGLTLLAKSLELGKKSLAERLIRLKYQIDGCYPLDKKNYRKTKTTLKKM